MDNNGKFHDATNSAEFIEAVQFFQRLKNEGIMKPRPANAEWGWDWIEFTERRQAGMVIAPEWRKGNLSGMRDDYGYVVQGLIP